MPRRARIDVPGALHHIIVKGMEGKKIFDDDQDRTDFVERLGTIIKDTNSQCLAWALIPNHFHLLLKTDTIPIATVMKRLLTGYAKYYNWRNKRRGPLFRNRYKSILCQEDAFLLELVRYIHLHPLRARMVGDIKGLDRFPYAGHAVLMGKKRAAWQNTRDVLKRFGDSVTLARKRYKAFLKKGIPESIQLGLNGSGVIRDTGGWPSLKALRGSGDWQRGDERILGDDNFVESVLALAKEDLGGDIRPQAKGVDIEIITRRVADLMVIAPDQIWAPGKKPQTVKARSLFCYWATSELGLSQAWLSQKLGLSQPAISAAVARGRALVAEHNYTIKIP